jgi:hypothetical protein
MDILRGNPPDLSQNFIRLFCDFQEKSISASLRGNVNHGIDFLSRALVRVFEKIRADVPIDEQTPVPGQNRSRGWPQPPFWPEDQQNCRSCENP